MRIGLIGCGRVGVTIFSILRTRNRIVGVYDSNARKQKTAVRSLRIRRNHTYEELISQSEVLFIATPDDAIIRAYHKMQPSLKGRKYVFHFSGILPADTLSKKKNVFRASIHPFATFPRIMIAPRKKHFFLSVEGDPQAIKCAHAIFNSQHFTLKSIRKKDKPLYHLIGVFSSNLLVGLVGATYQSANMMGWREKDIRHLIFPIITETLNNIEEYGLKESLSGPLRRGDVRTIEEHLKALQKNKYLLRVYKSLSAYIMHAIISGEKNPKLKKLFNQ